MPDNKQISQLLFISNLLEVKAAEMELLSRKLKSVMLQNEVRPIVEEDFKGQVSDIMHQIGMLESHDASVWKHYINHLASDFEHELSFTPFFRPRA
jgi:hypothetical protein